MGSRCRQLEVLAAEGDDVDIDRRARQPGHAIGLEPGADHQAVELEVLAAGGSSPSDVVRIDQFYTSPDVVDDVTKVAESLGKLPVVVGDKAGFIANALLFGYLNHAASMFETKYATREDIDAAMKLGCGLPMGPLALMDLIGLDTAYEILDTMYKQGRDRLHAPSPVLKQMVTAGLRGRKTGRGFYDYRDKEGKA